jgi:hypothetical protein
VTVAGRFRLDRVDWLLAGCAVATLLPLGDPVRPLLVVSFLLVGPGLALVRLLGLDDLLATAVLAVATSVTAGTLLAQAMVYAGWWSPGLGLGVMLAVTLLAVAARAGRVTA